jgi:IclR family transcriptional regulator, KDG regulon repressor
MNDSILPLRIGSKSWNVHDYHCIDLVGKVVRIVETLRDESDGLSLQDLAPRTGDVRSSLHRMLRSLRIHGYVEQDVTGGKYRLGMQLLALASGFMTRIELAKVSRSCFDITGSSH